MGIVDNLVYTYIFLFIPFPGVLVVEYILKRNVPKWFYRIVYYEFGL